MKEFKVINNIQTMSTIDMCFIYGYKIQYKINCLKYSDIIFKFIKKYLKKLNMDIMYEEYFNYKYLGGLTTIIFSLNNKHFIKKTNCEKLEEFINVESFLYLSGFLK